VHNKRSVFLVCLVCGFLFACNSTRHIPDGEYLLVKNVVRTDTAILPIDKFDYYIKQKPNRKILGLFRFHLWVYNLGLAGDTSVHPKRKRWLRKIGEEPVIFDSVLTEQSRMQFKVLMNKNGFFNAVITDSLRPHRKKMEVNYYVHYADPYKVRSLSYTTQDTGISKLINYYQQNSLIIPGERYDEEIMEKERDRITNDLRDRGYYFFNRNFITIQVDTSLGSRQADIYLYINRVNENVANKNGENYTIYDHSIYHLRNIYIQADYSLRSPNAVPHDTTISNGYYILSNTKYRILRDNVLTRSVFVKSGDTYLPRDVDYTYNKFQQLNVFKYINLVFKEVENNGDNHELDLFIQLTPAMKQDFTFEFETTNTGGNLGIAASAGLRNKNVFKGAEVLELKFKSGLEAIPDFTEDATKSFYFFNTYDFGPEINFSLKKIPFLKLSRFANDKTNISLAYNYENRPDYERSISTFALNVSGNLSKRQRIIFYPLDVNEVRVNLSDHFANELDQLKDPRLSYTYQTHLITSLHPTWIYTNQVPNRNQNFLYLRGTYEWAFKLFPSSITAAQFQKIDFDCSYHFFVNPYNNLVARLAAGYGQPYGGSTALPFEKSFFAGGANNIRAWNTGTLGPGSYSGGLDIEQSGDIEIIANLEYRSEIFHFPNDVVMEAATFIDAGNIWTSFEDASRPGAKFETQNIFREMGVGAGLGLRFNFNFFLFRLDGALKLRNPALAETQRWVYPNHSLQFGDVVLNFAIGYPF
jgi:outer membrane protein assembly factor BamA